MLVLILGLLATAFDVISGNVTVCLKRNLDPANDQLELFKERYEGPIGIMTTSTGTPISYRDATSSLNKRLLTIAYLTESLSHLNRERIPERIVHAKGGGAYGYFVVTNDISKFCKAELFSKVGKKTPIAIRFSSVVPDIGGSDLGSDGRGYSVRFYTRQGNFDIVGINFPVFSIKDPVKFPNFVHAIKRNPRTNLIDANSFWDFATLNPETFHQILYNFGDGGIPAGYVNIPGYSIHTYQLENESGQNYFTRFYFIPDAGIKNLTNEESLRIGAVDPDYFNRILYRDIANGKFPSWTFSVQLIPLDDVIKFQSEIFDATRIIPVDKYPLTEVGKLVLDRNQLNYFAEIEQLAFCIGNLVPGIIGDPSKLFESRRYFYKDAQYYRLGANFNKIIANCPYRAKKITYNRDGVPPVRQNERDIPNYYPNSFNGPVPYVNIQKSELIEIVEKTEPNNFDQAAVYYNKLNDGEKSRLISNIVTSLKEVTCLSQKRAVDIFTQIEPKLGRRIAEGLNAS